MSTSQRIDCFGLQVDSELHAFIEQHALHLQRPGPGLYLVGFGGQVASRLESEQGGDLAGELAEMHRICLDIAELAELVTNQWMIDDDGFHPCRLAATDAADNSASVLH